VMISTLIQDLEPLDTGRIHEEGELCPSSMDEA